MIRLDSVQKTYVSNRQKTTIGPVDLVIPAGGITAFIGPNGAGKSTLLMMVGRLLDIDEGTIDVGGYNVATSRSRDLAKVVSILRQDNHFVSRVTVRQLVGFGRFPHSRGRLTAHDENTISRYIDFFGLGDLEDRFLDELSGGQRQRAYVAMVLAQETDYVLLDEPLNNLDIARSVEMMQHVHSAARMFGRTIVVVLHDVNFAARYADWIVALKDGAVKYQGTPQQIMDGDVLTDIFDTPISVIDSPNGPLASYCWL
ncbi:ATP-binding cassette domain-containing protein [Schaalia sp. ZJ1691]|uniref:iron ABC transporter ATP-binding protein n=1 Tax=Schaalia sp. ZJ1691 TaxID=2709404 RepID=UPI0013EE1BDF|nr:ATP-binding cassette domain-containing protein [Schaalia sp. ZJ1691]